MAYLTQYSDGLPVIKFNIDQALMSIGQHIDMDICVSEDSIAGNHAAIEAIKQSGSYRFIIKCVEDERLIELNGDSISYAELKNGDQLVMGSVKFEFTDDGINQIKNTIIAIPVAEEVESIISKDLQADSRFSRRLNFTK